MWDTLVAGGVEMWLVGKYTTLVISIASGNVKYGHVLWCGVLRPFSTKITQISRMSPVSSSPGRWIATQGGCEISDI